MKCDKCGWRTSKKNYEGNGECFSCFEGLMIPETKRRTIEVLYSKEALKDIKKQGFDWWIIHSDEHPSRRKHIGYKK